MERVSFILFTFNVIGEGQFHSFFILKVIGEGQFHSFFILKGIGEGQCHSFHFQNNFVERQFHSFFISKVIGEGQFHSFFILKVILVRVSFIPFIFKVILSAPSRAHAHHSGTAVAVPGWKGSFSPSSVLIFLIHHNPYLAEGLFSSLSSIQCPMMIYR